MVNIFGLSLHGQKNDNSLKSFTFPMRDAVLLRQALQWQQNHDLRLG